MLVIKKTKKSNQKHDVELKDLVREYYKVSMKLQELTNKKGEESLDFIENDTKKEYINTLKFLLEILECDNE